MILLVLLAMAAMSVLMLLIARHAPITSMDDRLSQVDRELEISHDERLVSASH